MMIDVTVMAAAHLLRALVLAARGDDVVVMAEDGKAYRTVLYFFHSKGNKNKNKTTRAPQHYYKSKM